MRRDLLAVCVLQLLLSGCSGGSGGGLSSTPTPAPTPTPGPVDTLFTPTSSRTFAVDSAVGTATYDLSVGKTVSATADPANLTISYDVVSNSYTLALPGLLQTFGPGDRKNIQSAKFTYEKRGASSDDEFLAGFPSGGPETSSVSLSLWQHDGFSGSFQYATFGAFVYGNATAAPEIPRSGGAVYNIGIYGALSPPNQTPRLTLGTGNMYVDFQRSAFSLQSTLSSTNLLTGETITGGGLDLRASGHLTASGSFSGTVAFDNINAMVSGTISGRFYGSGAAEVGAAFSAENVNGTAFVGALSGVRTGLTPNNLALDAITTNQTLYGLLSAGRFQNYYSSGSTTKNGYSGQCCTGSQITLGADGSIGLIDLSGNGSEVSLQLTAADRVTSPDPNFTRYQKDALLFNSTLSEHAILDLYKPGGANTQLALSYVSFGIRSGHTQGLPDNLSTLDYFTYGIPTFNGVLAGRTGTAHYEGIVRGAGSAENPDVRYDVSGTSRYDVDFTAQSYSGSLTLSGAIVDSSTVRDFGTFTFSRALTANADLDRVNLRRNNLDYGELMSHFYGPAGDEIGGSFEIHYGNATNMADTTRLAGITVAKGP